MNLLTALLAVAAIVYVVARRFAGEPLEGRRLIVLPVVLTIIGATRLDHLHPTPVEVAVLVAEAAVAVVLGAVRGLTVQVYDRDGHLWYRYRPLTLAVWLGSMLIRLGFTHLPGAGGDALLGVLGLSLLAEALVVGKRALATGVPFAPQGSRRGR
jgi:hypothetical protein